jgi:hypothetical protein
MRTSDLNSLKLTGFVRLCMHSQAARNGSASVLTTLLSKVPDKWC